MKQLFLVSASLLLLAGCVTQLSQTPPAGMPTQVSAPDVRVGNNWRYAVQDGFTKLPRGTIEYRVSTVQGDTVTVEVLHEGRQSTELYTREWKWLRRPATNMQTFAYTPAYEAFAFPLMPGKTWRSRVTATDPADGRRFPVRIAGAVLGWERIKVPAGEFDTIKVRRDVFVDYWEHNVRGQSVIEEFEWYAPAVKQAVRRETTSRYLSYLYSRSKAAVVPVRDGNGDGFGPRYVQDDWLIYELVGHSER